jgi:hypothetical protein
MSETSIWNQMATLSTEVATLILNGIPVEPVRRRFPQSRFELDNIEIAATFGSDDPAAWISEATGAYLSEACWELQTLGLLLRNEAVTGSFEVVVRAAVERVGKISWILDHEVDSYSRARRATFEVAVSYYHYRRAVQDLGAPGSLMNPLKRKVREQREFLEAHFSVDKPLADPADADSGPTQDVAKWVVDGEAFPSFEKLTHFAMKDGGVGYRPSLGTYGALSCFSHPNVVAGWELRREEELSGPFIQYTYPATYLENLMRTAVVGIGNAFSRWLGYHDHDHDRLHAEMQSLLDRWAALAPPPVGEDQE